MKFLIQTFNGNIKHDFSFHLIEAIEFNNWIGKSNDISFKLTDGELFENFIPVGSVEFVCNYLNQYFGKIPKPKNIPNELLDFHFTGRNVFNGTEKDIIGRKFIKSNDKIKHFTEISNSAPIGNYQISDVIDIESEWRCFIYNKKLVGLSNYSGNFDVFPNVDKINEMIETYKNQPISFTLDVGIFNNSTIIIEVHDFFSCGLYGFSNYNILPFMLSNWFYEFCNK